MSSDVREVGRAANFLRDTLAVSLPKLALDATLLITDKGESRGNRVSFAERSQLEATVDVIPTNAPVSS